MPTRPNGLVFLSTLFAAAACGGGDPVASSVAGEEPGANGAVGDGHVEAGQASGPDDPATPGDAARQGGSPGGESGSEPRDIDPADEADADQGGPDEEPREGEPGPGPSEDLPSRYVRVRTLESPSWVAWAEIEVFGGPDLGRNLALGAQIDASSQVPGEPPTRAIDGDPDTAWNSGDFAPATVTVDLGQSQDVLRIRLRVAQSPTGPTTHQLSLGDASGGFTPVHTFEGPTAHGDWLEWVATDVPAPRDPPPVGDDEDPSPVDVEGLSRGLAWVRTHPMFISGLTVQGGRPVASDVNTYFDEFHANAAHLWTTGTPDEVQGWLASGRPDMRWLSWLQNDGTSPVGGAVAGGLGASPPGRIGYQLGDEPGLDRDGMDDMREIGQGAAAVRAVDPEALIVCNFSFIPEEVDQLMDHFGGVIGGDVISYDHYTRSRGAYATLAQFRAAGLRWGLPYWRYLRSYDDAGSNDFSGEADMRWDAMSGLVFGYTGHSWFLYQVASGHGLAPSFFVNTGDLTVERTQRFAMAARLNVQLANLGRAITQLTSTDIRYVPAFDLFGFEQPEGTSNWAAGAGDDRFLTAIDGTADLDEVLVGFFRDDVGEIYVMFQNVHRPGGDFPNQSADEMTVRLEFDFSGDDEVDRGHLLTLDKDTGEVVSLPLTPTGRDGAELEVRLLAGEAVLYKYATGRGFRLGR